MRLRHLLATLVLFLYVFSGIGEPQRPALHRFSYNIPVPGNPFGIVTSADGTWVFVGLGGTVGAAGIGLLHRSGDRFELARVFPLPQGATGIDITHDGKLLVAAAGTQVYFLDVSGVAASGPGAMRLAGSISDGSNPGSIGASITADDRWLFVCDENTGQITAIDLNRARSNGFAQSSIVGRINVGNAPTATVFSPDGVWAYTTVESTALGWPRSCPAQGSTDPTPVVAQGAVVVFQVAAAASNPGGVTRQSVPAGCSPVRLTLSPDGLTLYVTARTDNLVLALDTTKFSADPMNARMAAAPVGVAPVPVAVVDSGRLVVVGNSNRFFQPGVPQSLTVVDADGLRAGAGAAAVLRTVRAGAFPRTLTLSPDGRTLFLANYDSNTVQVIDVTQLLHRNRP